LELYNKKQLKKYWDIIILGKLKWYLLGIWFLVSIIPCLAHGFILNYNDMQALYNRVTYSFVYGEYWLGQEHLFGFGSVPSIGDRSFYYIDVWSLSDTRVVVHQILGLPVIMLFLFSFLFRTTD